jgi:hypothetical protein
MRTVTPPPPAVRVWKSEEKGSDVNLASYLVRDAFTRAFEQALVLSNDSDLTLPVRLVRDEAKLPIRVGFPISNPGRRRSVQLQGAATDFRDIRPAALAACQLPNPVVRGTSSYRKVSRPMCCACQPRSNTADSAKPRAWIGTRPSRTAP